MKIEQILVQYLYKNKSVGLQDIGTFTISPEVTLPAEGDKDFSLPEGAISFEFDKKTPQDEGLVDFIKTQSGKIRSLAASDLESYSILTRQFLNIGKPLHIEGLGVLQKTQEGFYNFTQGNQASIVKLDSAPVAIKEKIKDDISFASSSSKAASSSAKSWMIAILSIFLISAAAAAYYYFTKEKEAVQATETAPADAEDSISNTIANVSNAADSSQIKKDSSAATQPQKASDGTTFKIVLREYPAKAAAEKAAAKYTSYGHNILLLPKDSSVYRIAIPFKSPLADTARAVDSLRRFFGGKPYILL